jgi:hypothetical protein
MKRRRSKYNAVRTVIGNVAFHSKGEAHRWVELKHLENAGLILDLRRQVPFKLYAWAPEGEKVQIGVYRADFCYRDLKTNQEIVEDFKGAVTAHYRRTAKIMLANYGITILETRRT